MDTSGALQEVHGGTTDDDDDVSLRDMEVQDYCCAQQQQRQPRVCHTAAPRVLKLSIHFQDRYLVGQAPGATDDRTGVRVWEGAKFLAQVLHHYLRQDGKKDDEQSQSGTNGSGNTRPDVSPGTAYHHPMCTRQRNNTSAIVELGYGVGLVGLVAAKYFPDRVVMTDMAPAALRLARQNIITNHVHATVQALRWGTDAVCKANLSNRGSHSTERKVGLVLAADVVYPSMTDSLIEDLFASAEEMLCGDVPLSASRECALRSAAALSCGCGMCALEGRFLLAYCARSVKTSFRMFRIARAGGWTWKLLSDVPPDRKSAAESVRPPAGIFSFRLGGCVDDDAAADPAVQQCENLEGLLAYAPELEPFCVLPDYGNVSNDADGEDTSDGFSSLPFADID